MSTFNSDERVEMKERRRMKRTTCLERSVSNSATVLLLRGPDPRLEEPRNDTHFTFQAEAKGDPANATEQTVAMEKLIASREQRVESFSRRRWCRLEAITASNTDGGSPR